MNLLAVPQIWNLDTMEKDTIEKDTMEKEIYRNTKEEWHAVTKGVKREDGRIRQAHHHIYSNIHNALQDITLSDNKNITEPKTSLK